ncbi:MAG: acid-activated urea channel [Lachnospiraceae bacterium]|nr:acid-activated urea channel [Lachnospiraceae bacterium]
MLGVCLLFVGIVLINNGVCRIWKVDPKAAAVMNIFVGGLSVIINVLSLIQGNYYAAGTGLLFGFTYLFVAINNIFDLDTRPFAVFSVFVAVNAVVFGIVEGITGSTALGITPDWRWAVIWWLWAILWGSALFTDILKKDPGNKIALLQIFEGIVTAWIPGVLMLLKLW